MSTDNKSPSYLQDRERARRFLLKTADGKMATEMLRREIPGGDAAHILDDDEWTQWDDLVEEYKGYALLAANNAEARAAFDIARQSKSTLGPPLHGHAAWRQIMSTPLGYVLRRQIETGDPDYWNDNINLYREALAHPEWCTVPPDYIRGRLEQMLPKGPKNQSPDLSIKPAVLPTILPKFEAEIPPGE